MKNLTMLRSPHRSNALRSILIFFFKFNSFRLTELGIFSCFIVIVSKGVFFGVIFFIMKSKMWQ